jgi:hypothetical protein
MQINLRKANALQSEIKRAINSIVIDTVVAVNEFTPSISDAIFEAKQKVDENRQRKASLVETLYEIRNKVGKANAEAGINEVLTTIQLLDARAAVEGNIILASPITPTEELLARVNKIAKSQPTEVNALSVRSIYRDANVVTGVLTKEEIKKSDEMVKSLKREKRRLEDQLLQLNVNTLITLSASSVDTLSNEGIL